MREALARLQQPGRARRVVRRVRRRVKASMRKCLAELDRQLGRLGLWRKGFEVRGGWSRGLERHFMALGLGSGSERAGGTTPPRVGPRRHNAGHCPDSAARGGIGQRTGRAKGLSVPEGGSPIFAARKLGQSPSCAKTGTVAEPFCGGLRLPFDSRGGVGYVRPRCGRSAGEAGGPLTDRAALTPGAFSAGGRGELSH